MMLSIVVINSFGRNRRLKSITSIGKFREHVGLNSTHRKYRNVTNNQIMTMKEKVKQCIQSVNDSIIQLSFGSKEICASFSSVISGQFSALPRN